MIRILILKKDFKVIKVWIRDLLKKIIILEVDFEAEIEIEVSHEIIGILIKVILIKQVIFIWGSENKVGKNGIQEVR